MARPKNENSVRQRAFTLLTESKDVKRSEMIKILQETFNIGKSYAMSLHATHRTIGKNNNTMTKTYIVRDSKNGQPSNPFIKTLHSFAPSPNDARSPDDAIERYVNKLEQCINTARRLVRVKNP